MAVPESQPVAIRIEGQTVLIEIHVRDLLQPAAVAQVNTELMLAADSEPGKTFVVDFAGVTAVSSELIGALIVLQKRIADEHGTLRLCGLGERVQRTFQLSHVDRAFDIYTDQAAARP